MGFVEAEYTLSPQPLPEPYSALISQRRDTDSSFYHFDAFGNTRKLADDTGAVTDEYAYEAFGSVFSSSGTTENPYQWIGQKGYYSDADSGLYSLRRRQYTADEGRFVSEDPIGLESGDANFYRYVGNNAVNVTDPSGLEQEQREDGRRSLDLSEISMARMEELIQRDQADRVVRNSHTEKVEISNGTAQPSTVTRPVKLTPAPYVAAVRVGQGKDAGVAIYMRSARLVGTEMEDNPFVPRQVIPRYKYSYTDAYQLVVLRQGSQGLESVLDAIPIIADAAVFSPIEAREKELHYQSLKAVLHTVPYGTLADELADTGTVSGATALRTAVDSTIFLFPAAGAAKAAGHVGAGRALAGGALLLEVSDSSLQAVEGYQNYTKGERAAGAAQMILALAQIVFSGRELGEFRKIKPDDWNAFRSDFLQGLDSSKPKVLDGVDDVNAPRVAGIAGDAPKVRWKLNPHGLVRSEDEILDVLRRGGVEIPDDVAIFVGEADEFVGTLDDLLAGRNALTARMPGLTEDAAGYVHFNHMHNRFAKIPIRINPSMMASDDAILAVMKHELHELGLFREAFRRGNGRMTFDAFRAEAMPGNPGNYHWQAWDAADDLILWWRGLK